MNKNNSELSTALLTTIKAHEDQYIKRIRERLGILIHSHQTMELHKTILDACLKFNCSTEEYLQMLTSHPDDSPVLEHLIAGITVGETYFFRDKHQMQLLQETILPLLIKSKRAQKNLSLRIWSAGCASGEEIYTLGMMLLELLPDVSAWRLQLLGTDLNTHSLQKAMAGHYTEWSMRSISNYFKQRYFKHDTSLYILSDKIRDLVRFDYLNLNDDTYPSLINGTNAQDLILCRNVLIYFDIERISPLMQKINKSLIPGGYLFLGASDPIMTKETNLIFHHHLGNVFSYPMLENPLISPPKSITDKTKTTPNFQLTTKIKSELAARTFSEKPIIVSPNQKLVTQLLNENRWQEVLETIHLCENSGNQSSFLLNAKATACANLGKLEQALQYCLDSLKLDATNKYTYFTYALTLAELNRLEEAETALRKTLFLDHQFVVGHFQLGLLLLRRKQREIGLKSLTNALTIAETKNPTEAVPGYQGLYYGRLSEIFKHEIEIYGV